LPILKLDATTVEYEQEGAGSDLLLLHSLLAELSVFERVLPGLAGKRRVTRINFPGFGQSGSLALDSVAGYADHVAMVMCGALDQTTPPALARELARGISGADYREIPACGHCPMLDQPGKLAAAIEAFLTDVPGP